MELSEARLLKILMLSLGLIMLLTTIWASVRAEDFQDKALQNMGGIVFGVMTLTFGLKIDDSYSTKASLMSGFILVIGTAFATRELCYATASAAESGGSITATVIIPFIGVLMGFVLSGSSGHITGRKKSKNIRLIWMMVVISFMAICTLMVYRIIDLLPLFGTTPAFYAVLIGYICYLIVFVYGVHAMFSDEIKYNMKIGVAPAPEEP
ncbi:MAG: hypothetical protein LBP82_02680 [Candidatus Methanoplasma sp.]|jgi:hypothetical protein|nr:hypothetical protein [Candidatus Methanoplasma sp.]